MTRKKNAAFNWMQEWDGSHFLGTADPVGLIVSVCVDSYGTLVKVKQSLYRPGVAQRVPGS